MALIVVILTVNLLDQALQGIFMIIEMYQSTMKTKKVKKDKVKKERSPRKRVTRSRRGQGLQQM